MSDQHGDGGRGEELIPFVSAAGDGPGGRGRKTAVSSSSAWGRTVRTSRAGRSRGVGGVEPIIPSAGPGDEREGGDGHDPDERVGRAFFMNHREMPLPLSVDTAVAAGVNPAIQATAWSARTSPLALMSWAVRSASKPSAMEGTVAEAEVGRTFDGDGEDGRQQRPTPIKAAAANPSREHGHRLTLPSLQGRPRGAHSGDEWRIGSIAYLLISSARAAENMMRQHEFSCA